MNAEDLVSRARAAMLIEHEAFDHSDAANVSSGDVSGGPFIDAVIVPAARPAENLRDAISLAASTGAFLVLLCSRDALPREAAEVMARAGHAAGMVIALPDGWSHPLLSMSTDHIPDALWGWPRWDLNVKRNIGLLLAGLVGWERVLFVDDDIRELDATRVRLAGSLLDRYEVVRIVVELRRRSRWLDGQKVTGSATS